MVSNKRALISGGNGQDSSYLSELLLDKGYEVHITLRRTSKVNIDNIKHIIDKLKVHYATLTNYGSLYKVIQKCKPDEVYHLAAQSFVANSFDDEFSTMQTNINGTHYMLNACKEIVPECNFYYAATSEMYGNVPEPQHEETPMEPVSPYGISKLTGYKLCHYYREAFNMFVCCGILFNHESPRRGLEFVTRKICEAAKRGEKVALGNLDAKRDWGFAGDYVEAMWKMLQMPMPDDYVIATGETHTVRELAELAYRHKGLNYQEYVEVDPRFFRANELRVLRGDATKANILLEWKPKVNFQGLIKMMMTE